MPTLPSNVNYGQVVGQLLEAWGDGAISPGDADVLPDAKACTGTVRFTATPTYVVDATATPNPVTIFPKTVTCKLDSNGYLLDPDGNQGVYLVADDDPDLNPTGWTWNASFNLDGIPQFSRDFSVGVGMVVDLSNILGSSIPAASGTITVVTPSAVISVVGHVGSITGAMIAADSALIAAFAPLNIPEYLLPAPSVFGDDTAAINAILGIAGPKIVRARPGAMYNVASAANGSLIIPSYTYFDCRGATFTRISGGPQLLHNAAYLGSGARDQGINVLGGTWNHNSAATMSVNQHDQHTMTMHRVDGVRVDKVTVTDNGTLCKYGVLFGDVTDYGGRDIRFTNRPSDGVHVQGPATSGRFENISGYTGDDFIGVTACDYSAYQLTQYGGNINDLTIDGVELNACASGVLLLAGTNTNTSSALTLSGVTVKNIKGSVGAGHTVRVCDDSGDAGTTGGIWDDIHIENVSAGNNGGGYGMPFFAHSAAGRTAGAVMRKINVKDVYLPNAADQVYVSNANIESLTIDGIRASSTVAIGSQGAVGISAGSVIGSLGVNRVRLKLATSGYVVKQQGTVTDLTCNDWKSTGSTGGELFLAGTTTTVYASDWDSAAGGGILVSADHPTIYAYGCRGANTFVNVSGSSTARLVGGGIPSTNAIGRSAAQAMSCNGRDLVADVSKLTPVAGDSVTNYNAGAALMPAAIVCTYDGSNWRAERGWIKSGIATLVAGTVNVALTQVTGNSKIRLEMYTPGGTVGYQYVSARTAGTGFTITSTNAADTSQVYWELVQV